MATASVPNTFANDTNADATKVNANFTAILAFLNTEVIQKDGSLAFTAVPTGPATDPTLANHLVRKAYVDAFQGRRTGGQWRRAAAQAVASGVAADITMDTEDYDTDAFGVAAGVTFTVPAAQAGVYVISGWGITTTSFIEKLQLGITTPFLTGSLATYTQAISPDRASVVWCGVLNVGDSVKLGVKNGASGVALAFIGGLSIWKVSN